MSEQRAPTDAQIARLYALARRAGVGREAVHDEIMRRYGAESTRELDPREYEAYTADLARLARHEREPVRRQTIRTRAGCAEALRAQWPDLIQRDPQFADQVVAALDAVRLYRRAAAMGEGVARWTIGQLQRLYRADPEATREAVGVYLAR